MQQLVKERVADMLLQPKLDILPDSQKALWPQLKDIPQEYVLYGGTAIALRYGHRNSVDFDFFSTEQKDIQGLSEKLPFIVNNPPCEDYIKRHKGQHQKIHNRTHIDYFLEPIPGLMPFNPEISIVKVTFANDKDLIAGSINSPDKALGNGIKIASPLDLMAAKLFAMSRRSQPRDFVDLAEMIKHGVNLQKGFEAAFAVSKLSPSGKYRINYSYLKEDLKAKTVHFILPEKPDCVEIIREAATKVDIDKVMKTRLKAQPVNFKQIGMGR